MAFNKCSESEKWRGSQQIIGPSPALKHMIKSPFWDICLSILVFKVNQNATCFLLSLLLLLFFLKSLFQCLVPLNGSSFCPNEGFPKFKISFPWLNFWLLKNNCLSPFSLKGLNTQALEPDCLGCEHRLNPQLLHFFLNLPKFPHRENTTS